MRKLTEATKVTLDGAADYYAATFMANQGRFNRDWVMTQFYNFTYKDEFEYLVKAVTANLGETPRADFEKRLSTLPVREDAVFAALLEEKWPAGYTPKEG